MAPDDRRDPHPHGERRVARSPRPCSRSAATGPLELRPAFAAAHREWLLSTDFARTLAVLKDQLADPTADATCETLLIAHELGGTDLDRRLDDLADDRRADTQDRKDALAKQAGVRFARRFVLIVPDRHGLRRAVGRHGSRRLRDARAARSSWSSPSG